MYRKQMTVQKIICFAALVICAGVFIYSLGILTDLYDAIYAGNVRYADDAARTKVPGSTIYFEMQDFNRLIVNLSIGMIVLALFLFFTNTHSRRRYYIGNFVSVAVFAAGSTAMSVWAHIKFEFYKAQYLQMDFEALKKHADKMKSLYTESTFWFDAHYVVFGLLMLVAVLLVANAIWKVCLMRNERNLLKEGRKAEK